MIFVLDNYDSFTYNLIHLLYALRCEVEVRRNRHTAVADILALRPEAIVLSPGPGRPEAAGILPELVGAVAERGIPTLGVCLGHQAIGQYFGGRIVPAREIRHGKTSPVTHGGDGLFAGVGNPFQAVRYHSLGVERDTLPPELEVTATADDGEIMGLRHRTLPLFGLQFHPESIMTPAGKTILGNFIKLAGGCRRRGGVTA